MELDFSLLRYNPAIDKRTAASLATALNAGMTPDRRLRLEVLEGVEELARGLLGVEDARQAGYDNGYAEGEEAGREAERNATSEAEEQRDEYSREAARLRQNLRTLVSAAQEYMSQFEQALEAQKVVRSAAQQSADELLRSVIRDVSPA